MRSVYDLKGDEDLTMEQKLEVIVSTEPKRPRLKIDVENEVIEDSEGSKTFIYLNNRKFGCSPKWKSFKSGVKYQELCEDKNLQISEDWESIPLTSCRCCKKENVPKWDGIFFEHHWDFETAYSFSNGYCKECAEQKAQISHPIPEIAKQDFLREVKYEVGGESFTFRTDKDGFIWYWKNEKKKTCSSER